jgi:TP901 family phage tail tape measure protein
MKDAILGFGLAFTLEDRFTQTCKNIRSELGAFVGDTAGFQAQINNSMNGVMNGFGMMGAGVAMLAPLGVAVKEAANFEVQLKELSAITGVTGADLEDIGNRAQGLALKFGGDPLKSVDSFKTILSRLGPDIAKSPLALQNMGDAVETLAKTMSGDTLGSVNALTTGMLQYGIDLSSPIEASKAMVHQMNVMAAGAQVGSAEVPQIAASLKVSGLAAKAAGLSFEEANAAIQVMGKGTVYGAEAGTALRNVLGKLGESRFIPKDTSEELQKAGVDINLLANTTIPLSQRLQELNKIQNDSALIGKFFGVENKNAAMLLMQNIGDLQSWTKAVTGTNSATDQAEVIMSSFNESLTRGQAAMKVASISIGTALLPMASKLLNITGKLLTGFSEFAQSDIGKTFVKIAGAVGVGLVAMGGFVASFHTVKMAITVARPAFEWFRASVMATNMALLPYLATAAAVGVVIYGLSEAYSSFSDLLSGKTQAATGFLGFLQKVGGLMHFVQEAFTSATATSVDFSAETQAGLQKLGIEGIAYNLGKWVINIKGFFTGVWGVISNLGNNFGDLFTSLGRASDAIGNLFGNLLTIFGFGDTVAFDGFKLFGTIITQAVIFPLKVLIGLIEVAANTVTFLAETFNSVFTEITAMMIPIRLEWELFTKGFITLPDLVSSVAGRVYDTMSSLLESIWVGFKEMLMRNIAALPGGEFLLKQVGITSPETTAIAPATNQQEPLLLNKPVAEAKATQANVMNTVLNNINQMPAIPPQNGGNGTPPIFNVYVGGEQLTDVLTSQQDYNDKRKN